MNLTFYIYHKNGITLEDCEKVNNALEEPLDRFDITNGAPYVLNISSPGLDRPIVSEADFRRSLDTEVEVLLKEKIGKKTKLWGILTQYDEQKIVLTKDNTNTEILRPNIKLVRPYIKF
jgi:ribosome maturation factor RimP